MSAKHPPRPRSVRRRLALSLPAAFVACALLLPLAAPALPAASLSWDGPTAAAESSPAPAGRSSSSTNCRASRALCNSPAKRMELTYDFVPLQRPQKPQPSSSGGEGAGDALAEGHQALH